MLTTEAEAHAHGAARLPPLPRYEKLLARAGNAKACADNHALRRAYDFTIERHKGQKRASGEAYASHPVEVAGILADLNLDSASIITGLLHDTVEDGVATQDEINHLFGTEVGRLVDGVTKLGEYELQPDDKRQAEDFRKFFLAMSRDIRVLLVKLADRLHNMRTLRHLEPRKRRLRIARETMEIYAPLAERIGMRRLKDELEDLAFTEINPGARESLCTRLEFLQGTAARQVPIIAAELQGTLHRAGIEATVEGRAKEPYSIWRKMEKKHVSFDEITDVIAFRVLVADAAECYRALGAVHGAYPMVPERFKDYISTPKANDYRSLHTAVIGPRNRRIEVQIRSHEMHQVAEYGLAAHWLYKQENAKPRPREGRTYAWLQEVGEILEHAANSEEVLENTKLQMHSDQVFCFTPKGDIIGLPNGATPVDFAYAVHSDVGDTCVGAKINERLAPRLLTPLRNGDQVEILRSSEATPDPRWEKYVVTGKARARIRRFVRLREENEHAALGRAILEKTFRDHGRAFDEATLREDVLSRFGHVRQAETCAAISRGTLAAEAVLLAVHPDLTPHEPAAEGERSAGHAPTNGANTVPVAGRTPGMAVHFATCCHPLRGDRIVGIMTKGRGVTVHTIDCQVLENFSNAPERWLDLAWHADIEAPHVQVGRIVALMSNRPGSLNALTEVIARAGCNIINLQLTNRTADYFEFVVDIEVEGVRQLTGIVTALRAIPAFFQVERERA